MTGEKLSNYFYEKKSKMRGIHWYWQKILTMGMRCVLGQRALTRNWKIIKSYIVHAWLLKDKWMEYTRILLIMLFVNFPQLCWNLQVWILQTNMCCSYSSQTGEQHSVAPNPQCGNPIQSEVLPSHRFKWGHNTDSGLVFSARW